MVRFQRSPPRGRKHLHAREEANEAFQCDSIRDGTSHQLRTEVWTGRLQFGEVLFNGRTTMLDGSTGRGDRFLDGSSWVRDDDDSGGLEGIPQELCKVLVVIADVQETFAVGWLSQDEKDNVVHVIDGGHDEKYFCWLLTIVGERAVGMK